MKLPLMQGRILLTSATVLFLRHRLQRGFLSEQPPREDEMPQMSDYIRKLEAYQDLEPSIIRGTKINKVLKALNKLNTIPRDEEFQFRKRSVDLLLKWNKVLQGEAVEATSSGKDKASPATNGVHPEKEKSVEKGGEAKVNEDTKAEEDEKKTTEETTSLQPSVADAVDTPQPGDTKPKDSVDVVDKAPESAAGAAVVQEVVKATE